MTKAGPPTSGPGAASDVIRSTSSLGTLDELLARRGLHGSADTPQTSTQTEERHPPAVGPDLSRCGKLTVSRERKGHGGKAATVVSGLGLPARDLEGVARALRRALGCGASIDGDRLVIQGEQVPRVQAWLGAQGARRVVAGN
jgi:translation initiation factor 1 (eIF-1/SUI1)